MKKKRYLQLKKVSIIGIEKKSPVESSRLTVDIVFVGGVGVVG